jgi:DNA-binding transcriptional LysR family regulator
LAPREGFAIGAGRVCWADCHLRNFMFPPRHLHLLATFVEVCREGSFTKAARKLGISKSIVSGQVRMLEEILAARVLERSTRQVALTQIGHEVLGAAERMLSAAGDVAIIAESKRAVATGVLRVAAPIYLGEFFVAPAVARLVSRFRELRAELLLSDEKTDPIALQLDAVVSVNASQDSNLVGMPLANDLEIIVCAPELAPHWQGATQPNELLSAPWVVHSCIPAGAQHHFRTAAGSSQSISPSRPVIRANTLDALRALISNGAGLGILPALVVAEDIRAGRMLRLLPDWQGRALQIHAWLPSDKHRTARVTLFLEELRAAFDGFGL